MSIIRNSILIMTFENDSQAINQQLGDVNWRQRTCNVKRLNLAQISDERKKKVLERFNLAKKSIFDGEGKTFSSPMALLPCSRLPRI